ncbi:MAG: hypothetical protein HY293_11210, partial [Planctomycetes bacterium]|nr:hypothetical protein [Planctomycetota bacterium]
AWYGGAVGGDYTVVHTDVWYLRGQLGVMYAFWNGVNSLDNGMGIMGGVQVGFNWIKGNSKTVITITPQFSYDGDAWIAFITAGFSIDF